MIWGIAVALVLAGAMAAGDLAAQGSTPPSRNRRVWTGTIDDREILLNAHDTTPIRRPVRYFQDVQVSFVFVSEDDPDRPGFTRWVSRRLTWQGYAKSWSSIEGRECRGQGSVDLGPAEGSDMTTPAQDAQLKIPCRDWNAPNVWSFIPVPNPKVRLPEIDMSMTNCEPTRRWEAAGVRYTLSVAGESQADAVLEISRRADDPYTRFVPKPGATLSFTASARTGAARFRFELDRAGTSHFPGYATNANVDDVFFVNHNLGHLRGQYANDGPDVIFDPERFGTDGWSRREPGLVETRAAETAVVVTVTAMDYGAVGRLRGYVASQDCGGTWQPVTILVDGQPREAIDIPQDEDDNLIADALKEYHFLASGVDDDAEPDGSAVHGDGVTAFEEYRGFMTAGASCDEPWTDRHVRTTPRTKDLFVATEHPILARILPLAKDAFELDTRLLCGRHIVEGTALLNILARNYDALNVERGELTGNRDARIVNFTLQGAALRQWMGHAIALESPQRAVAIVEFLRATMLGTRNYPLGLAIPVEPNVMGPPGATALIIVSFDDPEEDVPSNEEEGETLRVMRIFQTVLHELGHAIGIPHHSDSVENWQIRFGRKNITAELSPRQRSGSPPDFNASIENADVKTLIVEPGPACREADDNAAFRSDKFVGCLTPRIVRRGQENSGESMCPMRYGFGRFSYYEPPGVSAVYRWTDHVRGVPPDDPVRSSMSGPRPNELTLTVDAWGGRLLRYQTEREVVPLGMVCARPDGTEINAGSGDRNHSGDLGRPKPCRTFIVVNDSVLRGGS